ncbi:uncharacterized protein LOC106652474 [Trichogramma pretiosum]|uniref:uncharacterized protein LOC106652474 n=1 Tax=Trichogramma pretiosum TaxID=7493 RepID=UPI000C71BF90|nr:uncharacterized protein LOC106652474 [Trichogramma pretiosum]
MPKAVVTTLSTSTTSNDGKYDEASKLRSEVIQLKEGIDRVRYERDEARLRLRVAEERCEAYETESKYLEATLDSMEEKIRDLARELSAEVMRSRTLEQQLSLILSNSTSSKPKLQQTDKVA